MSEAQCHKRCRAADSVEEAAPAAQDKAPQQHPEARKTSEWRKALWTMVSGHEVPDALTAEEEKSSWQQLPDCDDAEACGALERATKQQRRAPSQPASTEAASAAPAEKEQMMDRSEAALLEEHAAEQWERFYAHFGDGFFKDRHYLRREFPELFAEVDRAPTPPTQQQESSDETAPPHPVEVVEVGCGAGNTVMPLLAECASSPRGVHVHAFDFSESAVRVMCARPGFDAARCHAFVADASDAAQLVAHVQPHTVDFVLAVFALSALSMPRVVAALRALRALVVPGRGRLLLRDYGVGDLSQLRFVAKGGRQLGDSFYARGDGTCVLYFTKQALVDAAQASGWTVEEVRYDTRVLRNRKRQLNMRRVWVVATLLCPPEGEQPQPPSFAQDVVVDAEAAQEEPTSTGE